MSLREFELQLANSLRGDGNSAVQIAGERVDAEMRAFWDVLGVPARMTGQGKHTGCAVTTSRSALE